ncbi:hypothetical protein M8494_08780 [Serratia ureilytica]
MSFEGKNQQLYGTAIHKTIREAAGMRRMAKRREDDAMMRHPLKLIVDREENQ